MKNQGPQWFYCVGVLSNGFHFGEHLCSAPGYAPGDLYFNRKERQRALEELFGFTWNSLETETVVVNSKADIPLWWDGLGPMQDRLKEDYDKYSKRIKELKAEL